MEFASEHVYIGNSFDEDDNIEDMPDAVDGGHGYCGPLSKGNCDALPTGAAASNKGSNLFAAAEPPPYVSGRSFMTARNDPPTGASSSRQGANANVVCIRFSELVCPMHMHTGDPVRCGRCKAVLSSLSRIQAWPGGQQKWNCDFCENSNLISVSAEEQPKQEDVTYMISPAPSTFAIGRSGSDETLIVFCIDVSGSMSVSTPVPGRLQLRGGKVLDSYRRYVDDGSDQSLPRQQGNVTYVTRLQAVQTAVEQQLGDLVRYHPRRRPAVVAFNDSVSIIGDGTSPPICLGGDKMHSKSQLVSAVNAIPLPGPAWITHGSLCDRVFELEEGGRTALGPALVVAVSLASKAPGSKVLLCTDGLANVGLGIVEKSEQQNMAEGGFKEASAFYEELGKEAAAKGVSVSVLTIAGTNCQLIQLGRVAQMTSGQVNIVDPLKLTTEFGNILKEEILATNVAATFHVHKSLYICNTAEMSSVTSYQQGNVTRNSETTFEFGVRGPKQLLQCQPQQAWLASGSVANISQTGVLQAPLATNLPLVANAPLLPSVDALFQIQVEYTDAEGARALRVYTVKKPVTADRSKSVLSINPSVINVHAAQLASKRAYSGDYEGAQRVIADNERLLLCGNTTMPAMRRYMSAMAPLKGHVQRAQLGDTRPESSSDPAAAEYFGKMSSYMSQFQRDEELSDMAANEDAKRKSS